MNPRVQFVTIEPDIAGQRLDNFLIRILKGAPKSLIYRIIRKGEVRVNKGRAKPDRKLVAGDIVRVPPVSLGEKAEVPKAGEGLLAYLSHAILYECESFLVVNKPSGLAVHGGSGIHLGLIEALRQLSGPHDFRELVHRLDRDTSGCVIVAKKRAMLKYLHELLRDQHRVEKCYLALVSGSWPKRRNVVNAPLKKNELQSGERVVRVSVDGKPSVTEFSIVNQYSDATLVQAKPITGRTHQIRVHAQHAGHSLIADDKYGEDSINRQFRQKGFKRLCLHAHSLAFTLPDGERFFIEAPLPDDISQPLATLAE